jgi:hypothetical protein
VSFSFRLPEEDPVCECRYDEIRDRMGREDCPFHCNIAEDGERPEVLDAERKPPASVGALNDTGGMVFRRGSKP